MDGINMDLTGVYKVLVSAVQSNKDDYKILTKGKTRTRFLFVHFDVTATISLEKDSVYVKTESIFNVPPGNPASFAIKKELEAHDTYIRVLPSEGLVLFLSFSIDETGDVIANGRSLGPYFEELLSEMKGTIDAAWLITMEKFPYLAGQQAMRVGGDTIIVSPLDPNRKTIQSVISTVITRPHNHKYTAVFHDWIFGSEVIQDDKRLLPNFFIHNGSISFSKPEKKLIERGKNYSKYEYTGTKRCDSTPFFDFLKDLLNKIQGLPPEERKQYSPIPLNIKRLLEDPALIGTPDGEMFLISLNSDIRDFAHSFEKRGKEFLFTEEDVKKMMQWRESISAAINHGKYQERVMKARFAARDLENTPKVLGAEKRKMSRSGGGFSVYISPFEAQICELRKEIAVELVEEGNKKYLAIRKI